MHRDKDKEISATLKAAGYFLSAAVLLLPFLTNALVGTPPSGTIISNQSAANYHDDATGIEETVYSNTTEVTISAVEAVSLVPDLAKTVIPGEVVRLPHRLTNTGNIDTTCLLRSSHHVSNDFDLVNFTMVHDLNSNGVDDAGEPVIPQGGAVTFSPGENIDLVFMGEVPAGAGPGESSRVKTEVVSLAEVVGAEVVDTVSTAPAPAMVLSKTADRAAALPGDVVEFTLTSENIGAGDALPIEIRVDNVPLDLVIVRDKVPANSVFRAIVDSGTAQVLYHVTGDALHDYRSVLPVDVTMLDAVAFAYPLAPAGFNEQNRFSVAVNANAGGSLRNQALLYHEDSPLDSNTVVVDLPAATASIGYYTDAGMTSMTDMTHAGEMLYLGVDAAVCNTDAAVVEQYPVTLTAALSSDRENGFVITETGANTGVFTLIDVPTRLWPANPAGIDNDILEVSANDTVPATVNCGGITLSTSILIDPSGVVFDAVSNQPIAGATVTLVGIGPGGVEFTPAVFDALGNPLPGTVVTGADGMYEFPLVAAGDYRLDVVAPASHSFPSALAPAALPAGRIIDPLGSYGGAFTVSLATGPVFIDVPLDPGPARSGLFIDKTPSKSVAGLGESIVYTIDIANGTGIALPDAQLFDQLPAGFAYLPGSARLDETRLDDPAGAPGPRLVFNLGTLADAATHTLKYRVQIRAGALRGDGINSAQLVSNATRSNVAKARIRIADGVFRDEAYILGKIFLDCDRDGLQASGEHGIPGVRIYLDDGTFVVSDNDGMYSFAGISPRTHALKVDATTLPRGSRLVSLDNRNSGDPDTRFVDLKKGELHRADFTEGSCSADVLENVEYRRKQGEIAVAETEQQLNHQLRTDGEAPLSDPRTRPASGVREADGRIIEFVPLYTDARPGRGLSALPQSSISPSPSVNLDALMPRIEPGLGFIGLHDGDTVASRQLSIQVKGAAGARLQLRVNGISLPESRVGQKATMSSRAVSAWEYIAVKLKPGSNRLEVRQFDSFGNERGSRSITLIAPGSLGRLSVTTPSTGTPADGHTPAPIVVRLEDDNGVRVTARTPITLEASEGRWDVADLDPRERGVQTFIDGGEAVFDLLPPQVPGTAKVRVSSGVLESGISLSFLPDLRPLIAIGVIEGAVDFSRLDVDALQPATEQDSFEEQIRELEFGQGERLRGGVRGSMFLKGKVRGEYLLTLSYDSDKDLEDRLFRDIQPDEFYPVYGDSSVKGFDAQSSSRLYVRLDKGKSYMLYGDYTTQSQSEALKLGNYNRSLTGLRGHYENRRSALNYFAAYDDSRQRIVEIPGQGISGPYAIGAEDIVRNSEKVEIVTRDRNQPALVLESVEQARFTDYTLNAIDGTLLFRRPVSGIDANLNPVSIRITYEVDAGGEDFWIYGFNGQLRLSENIEIGASMVRDADPMNGYELYSANLAARVRELGMLAAEIARSSGPGKQGGARRIEYRHRGKRLDARLYAAEADADFDNPAAPVAAGRREAGARASMRMDEKTRLGGELLYTRDRETGGTRRGAQVSVERNLPHNLRAEIGVRHVKETTAALGDSVGTTPRKVNSARVKVGWQPAALPRANVSVEYEQDISDSNLKQVAVAGEYQLADRGRIYLRHEFINSLSGIYGLSADSGNSNRTVLGLDYDYMENGSLFNEYRLRDAISGREAEASIGLRNLWTIAAGLRIQTGFERVQPLTGDTADEATALTGAVEYTADKDWKGTARLELRRSNNSESLLNTVGYARRLRRDWTTLLKNTLHIERAHDSGLRNTRERLQIGLAFRDSQSNRWQGLARYEFKFEQDRELDDLRRVHMWSGHANYHPSRALTFSGRYAGKWVEERADDFSNDFMVNLLSGRVMYDINERWDVGVIASTLFMDSFASRRYGLGVEAGYQLSANLWLSTGYNFFGFSDEDLDEENASNPGVYARLRFKFDEEMFGWLE